MRTTMKLFSATALAALVLSAPALAQGTGTGAPPSRDQAGERARDGARQARDTAVATVQAKVGEKAPAFTLSDTEGKSHSLSDFSGKIVVLQWINPECPYCVRVMKDGQVKSAAKKATEMDKDVVWLLVNSTSHMPPKGSAEYLKEHELKFPALVDQPGTVGRLYGARTSARVRDRQGRHPSLRGRDR
jgi:peroxiredoxin